MNKILIGWKEIATYLKVSVENGCPGPAGL
jgi:hypothetical protein